MDFTRIQQTENQTLACFSEIKAPRSLLLYAEYQGVYGYARIEMTPQETEAPIKIEIKPGFSRRVTVIITNSGETDAIDLEYNITVVGGFFNFINKKNASTISNLEAGNETVITLQPFGFGIFRVNATVGSVSEKAFGLIFARFLYIPRILNWLL